MELTNYIDKLNEVYTTYRRQWEELQAELTKNASEAEKVQSQRAITELEKAIMYSDGRMPDNLTTETRKKADLDRLNDKAVDLRGQLDNLRNEAFASFQNLKSEFSVKMNEELTVKPEALDAAGATLLNSGALTDADVVALARRFNESPTMLRLIRGEAGKRKLLPLTAAIDKFFDTSARLRNFDIAIRDVRTGLSSDSNLANIGDSYWREKGLQAAKTSIGGADALAI